MSKRKFHVVTQRSGIFKQAVVDAWMIQLHPDAVRSVNKNVANLKGVVKDFTEIGYICEHGVTSWLASSEEGKWIWFSHTVVYLKKRAKEQKEREISTQ